VRTLEATEIGGQDPRNTAPGRKLRNALRASLWGTVAVQPFPHFLARLEERDALLIDRNMRAGARVASRTGRAMLDRESAETAQLDAVAARQRSYDLIENRIHNVLHIPLVEVRVVLGDALNEFGFDRRNWGPGSGGYAFP